MHPRQRRGRYGDQLVLARTAAKNQLHAEQAEAEPNTSSVARMKKQIVFFDKQEQEIKTEIKALAQQATNHQLSINAPQPSKERVLS